MRSGQTLRPTPPPTPPPKPSPPRNINPQCPPPPDLAYLHSGNHDDYWRVLWERGNITKEYLRT